MIRRLVAAALRAPAILYLLVAGLVAAGLFAYSRLDVEAYPNPVPPLVEVITQPEGWSAEEIERQVTIPLEIGLAGMPGLDHIRSQSLFGLSDVKCYFNWGASYKDARQEVINRLQFVTLPSGLAAQLSPWNAIGEVFRYIVRGKGYSLRDLKTAEDWILERELKQVPGVIDVVSFGGETRQVHVEVDPYRLRGQKLTLPQLTSALAAANQNVGGQRLTLGEQSYTVRGVGLFKTLHDVGEVVVQAVNGIPLRVRDVANVAEGARPRLGIVGHDREDDVVEGIVLMRYGGETKPTLAGIYRRLEHIRDNHLLPPGMDVEPYYNRGDLVRLTTRTVMENLLLGMALVCLVLFFFLGNTRGAVIAAVNIPLALLIAFCGMVASGTPANLISLGAIDFGIIVDSTVIVVENIFRHLSRPQRLLRHQQRSLTGDGGLQSIGSPPATPRSPSLPSGGEGDAPSLSGQEFPSGESHGRGTMRERVLAAVGEVGMPLAFSRLIIAVAFLPLFTMTGVSGVIFSPMAHTYAYAIGGAAILALTLTPVLAARFVPVNAEETENALMRFLHRLYDPLFDMALARPRLSLLLTLAPLALCVVLFSFIGREFMPKLEEGNFWIRATLPSSIALEQSSRYVGRMREIVRAHPEVESVVSQLGRPDDGTDVTGFNNIELFAPLRPFDSWPRGLTKEKLTERLEAELERAFPGVVFSFSQYILDNVEEAVSGVKGENSVKVVGPDLRANERLAEAIGGALQGVRGVRDVGLISSLGQPSVSIVVDRRQAARYGLNTADVEAVVQAAIGGQVVTQVFEGEKHFDLVVRWLAPFRRNVEAIRQITVGAPDGSQIPLGQLAKIGEEDGPSVIYREDGRRYAPVKFSVRGRDLAGAIAQASESIAKKVRLPYGTHLDWAGEINELNEAEQRLLFIIPLTLALIAFLVYGAVKDWLYTLVVLVNIPVACAGGLVALLLTGINFSVSAAMGFVSVFGIAIQDAILMVTYSQRQWQEGRGVEDGARAAAEQRFRPVLMTTLVAMLGLLPAAVSQGIGAQTQKPLAVVVIGGCFVLAGLTRIIQPPLLVLAHRWHARRDAARAARAAVPEAV
ncbi:MAG TPA: efflux RND transporter permease subunit [Thermoanaerobaculia bacterium]|nr:efflux RND transporter permease subunit [Thermoanaerobaculia bacterium]